MTTPKTPAGQSDNRLLDDFNRVFETLPQAMRYGAVAVSGGQFAVAHWTGYHWKPLGNVRWFESFVQADECAREIAAGKYEHWNAGEYVSLR